MPSVTSRLGKLARFFGCVTRYKHLASRTGKGRFAVRKIRPWCKTFVAGTEVALFTRCETSIAVAKTTVIRAACTTVVKTRAVCIVVALRCRATLEGTAAAVIATCATIAKAASVISRAIPCAVATKAAASWFSASVATATTVTTAEAAATTAVVTTTAEITAWAI